MDMHTHTQNIHIYVQIESQIYIHIYVCKQADLHVYGDLYLYTHMYV